MSNKKTSWKIVRETTLGLNEQDAYKSETWRKLEYERVYHVVSANPDRNRAEAVNAFLTAFRWRWGFAREIANVCQQIGLEKGPGSTRDLAGKLSEVCGAYENNQYQVGIKNLRDLQELAGLTSISRCEVYALCGHFLLIDDRNEDALIDLTRAVELDEKYAWAIVSRGETYRSMEKYEAALADYTRALELDEKDAWIIASRGQAYRSMEKYEEALADLNLALELNEKLDWAFLERGLIYFCLTMFDEALADLTRAIDLDEKFIEARLLRGAIYRKLGQFEKAVQDFTAVVNMKNANSIGLSQRAAAYNSTGDFNAARVDLEQVLELSLVNAEDYYGRCLAFVLLDEPGKALEMLKEAFRQNAGLTRLYVKIDDLINPLRNLTEFQSLMSDYFRPSESPDRSSGII